ncbi:hypothetical protein ACIQ9K_36585 [Streptomyces microflavus]
MFDSAVADCVHRVSAPAADLARHLAVLGPDALTALLDRNSTSPPTRLFQELTQAGLLAGPGLRHPRMRTVLCGEVSAEERARLHGRAAVLLHDNGAHLATVAEHIVVAGGIAESWAPLLLREAATEALAHDEFPKAMQLFDLAHAICPNGPLRASILFQRTLSAWQVDPAKAMRRLPELKEALEAGHLTATSGAMSLIKNLVWHGYVDEAADVLWSNGSWPTIRARRPRRRSGRCSSGCRCCARRSIGACSAMCPWMSPTRSPRRRSPRSRACTRREPCPSSCAAVSRSQRWSGPRMCWRCPV